MGRKIPAKKHRGVKDPLQQQARRLQSLKGKINAPPKDPDEQPVPRSLTRLFAFQNQSDNKQNDENVRKKKPKRFGHDKPHQNNSQGNKNPISKMKQLPGESGRSFSLRINSAVKALHGLEDTQDYPPDLEEEQDMTGSRMDAQRRRRARKRRAGGAPAPSRAQRLALKKKEKKERDAEVAQAEKRELVYERVRFGEVAHAPPALSRTPRTRAAAQPGAQRPGRRDLLLSKLLGGGAQPPGARGGGGGGGRGGGGGARALPAAERMRRERARQAAVDAYRALKANAHKHKIT